MCNQMVADTFAAPLKDAKLSPVNVTITKHHGSDFECAEIEPPDQKLGCALSKGGFRVTLSFIGFWRVDVRKSDFFPPIEDRIAIDHASML
jgi:hypothetical protein